MQLSGPCPNSGLSDSWFPESKHLRTALKNMKNKDKPRESREWKGGASNQARISLGIGSLSGSRTQEWPILVGSGGEGACRRVKKGMNTIILGSGSKQILFQKQWKIISRMQRLNSHCFLVLGPEKHRDGEREIMNWDHPHAEETCTRLIGLVPTLPSSKN